MTAHTLRYARDDQIKIATAPEGLSEWQVESDSVQCASQREDFKVGTTRGLANCTSKDVVVCSSGESKRERHDTEASSRNLRPEHHSFHNSSRFRGRLQPGESPLSPSTAAGRVRVFGSFAVVRNQDVLSPPRQGKVACATCGSKARQGSSMM